MGRRAWLSCYAEQFATPFDAKNSTSVFLVRHLLDIMRDSAIPSVGITGYGSRRCPSCDSVLPLRCGPLGKDRLAPPADWINHPNSRPSGTVRDSDLLAARCNYCRHAKLRAYLGRHDAPGREIVELGQYRCLRIQPSQTNPARLSNRRSSSPPRY